MPELEVGKVLRGGGGGGDLLDFSDPCLVRPSVGADLVADLECLSRAGLAGFSGKGFGSFSGPFLGSLSEPDSDWGSSVTQISYVL